MKIKLLFVLILYGFYSRAQSGISWQMTMNIAANTYNNEHPRIVMDGKGNPLVIWGNSSTKKVMFTRWNGTAFTTPIALNPSNMPLFSASWAGPDIASKGDTVYIVFKQSPEDTNHIFILRSFNGGQSFATPVRVDFIGSYQSRFPTITTDLNGNPIVAFMKFDANFTKSRWVVSRSNDMGISFQPDVLAGDYSGGEACDCCPGGIVSSNNKVAMMYRDNFNNLRDVWTGVSSDNGVSFSGGIDIDQNKWNLLACPASGPDGVIIGDTLYSVYMNGGSGAEKVYRNKSSLANPFSSKGSLISGGTSYMQNFPRTANYNKAVAQVWQQDKSGSAQLGLYFTRDITKGFPVNYDTVAMNSSSTMINVDVAVYDGIIYVVWEEGSTGTVRYRKGTFNPVTTGIRNKNEDHGGINIYPNPANGDLISINLPGNIQGNIKIEISNLHGNSLIQLEQTAQNLIPVKVSDLFSGTYIIKVESEEGLYYSKFVILR